MTVHDAEHTLDVRDIPPVEPEKFVAEFPKRDE